MKGHCWVKALLAEKEGRFDGAGRRWQGSSKGAGCRQRKRSGERIDLEVKDYATGQTIGG
jgi:hypothetical protein